jgi:hypothetical protein
MTNVVGNVSATRRPARSTTSFDSRPAAAGSIAVISAKFEHEGPLPHLVQDQPQ